MSRPEAGPAKYTIPRDGILCEDERYLWALVRYIHGNPVRAGLAGAPGAYRWSSFREYEAQRWAVVDGSEADKVLGQARVVALAAGGS
jgi:hypothetical protein